MKSKQNVNVHFTFEQAEYNRVAAIYSLLVNIDKRISKNSKSKKSLKKLVSEKNKEDISIYICDGPGSRKKRAFAIFMKKIINLEVAYCNDRYSYTNHSTPSLLYHQA